MPKIKSNKKPSQCEKVLAVLKRAKGRWVNGRYFLRTLYFSQYHARIKNLEDSGYVIQHSPFVDKFGFKSYRLVK